MARNVDSTVKFNTSVINQLNTAAIRALELTAEALHTEVVQAQVVPRDTGNLQNEAFFVDTSRSGQFEVALIHSTPYARRLYFHPEYHFDHDKNPYARGKWFEDWISGKHKDFAEKAFAAFYQREAGV